MTYIALVFLLFTLLIASIVINMILLKTNRLTRLECTNLRKELIEMARNLKSTQTISTTLPEEDEPLVPEEKNDINKPALLKLKVLALVKKYRKEVNEEDLPKIQKYLKDFFDQQAAEPYYKVIDLRYEKEDRRIVVIGDTHCDYTSLAGIMNKLSLSSYDYFENAYFVFLGDYLDRGSILFENLLLLVSLKQLLGDRCIFLKGNHELIDYNKEEGLLESMVYPADSCPTLNEYCGEDKDFLEKFAAYFSQLPYYVLLKTQQGTDLFVHGGIPRDAFMDSFTISHDTGEMIMSGKNTLRNNILDNMIWSDPSSDLKKMQGASSRFEFGRQQFEEFTRRNKIYRIFRSHEPVTNGVKSFFDDRLYTIFSNGGVNNPDTGYEEVENPVFGIINVDGSVRFESIFFKKVTVKNGLAAYNTVMYMESNATEFAMGLDDLHLNNEFFIINQ